MIFASRFRPESFAFWSDDSVTTFSPSKERRKSLELRKLAIAEVASTNDDEVYGWAWDKSLSEIWTMTSLKRIA